MWAEAAREAVLGLLFIGLTALMVALLAATIGLVVEAGRSLLFNRAGHHFLGGAVHASRRVFIVLWLAMMGLVAAMLLPFDGEAIWGFWLARPPSDLVAMAWLARACSSLFLIGAVGGVVFTLRRRYWVAVWLSAGVLALPWWIEAGRCDVIRPESFLQSLHCPRGPFTQADGSIVTIQPDGRRRIRPLPRLHNPAEAHDLDVRSPSDGGSP